MAERGATREMAPRVCTAVVGAGPAGLLFAVAARILAERAAPGSLAIKVYDKRDAYVRTHRLRIAEAPWRELAADLADPHVDALIGFLDEAEFAPEVNALEERLVELLAKVGVTKERLAVGEGEGETSLSALRARLEAECLIGPATLFTIVAADSVHSAVRELVRGGVEPERHTHEQLARLRVVGPSLPRRLGAVDQARLSRVLGSIVDYRLNKNGFAEVDLFLSSDEFEAVRDLGASPRDPVRLSHALLDRLRAPLFRAIVEHLETAPGGALREVLLQSTFRLEHAVMPRLVFEAPEADARVFLVGDAGISLPFQRGMACLAACAHQLARVHAELASSAGGDREREALARRYDDEAARVKRREIAIVTSRARLVRTLREIVRWSALLPFPVQSWWLRVPRRPAPRDRLSVWFFTNLALAGAAGGLAIAALARSSEGLQGFAFATLPIEATGGVAYHAALAFEGGAHRLVRRVWELQLAAVFATGAALWARDVLARGPHLDARPFASLVLAAAFATGAALFERFVAGWFERAGLRYQDGDDARP